MTKYLYGAAVQGIQSFIFQTNKLREIVGASELVEEICTEVFENTVTKYSKDYHYKSDNSIIQAAGHIKYLFDSEDDCKQVVLNMPKIVQEHAPGITFSQAVVVISDNDNFSDKVDELERYLKIQRNKPMRSQTIGWMGVLRSRHTGLPVTNIRKIKKRDEYLDAAANAKYVKIDSLDDANKTVDRNTTKELSVKAFGIKYIRPQNLAYDIEDLTKFNDWVAIIHADGNGLGQVISKIGKTQNKYKDFSQGLDRAIVKAAQEAFDTLVLENRIEIGDKKIIPIRPIALSGEDFNVICRGDLAIPYMEKFFRSFQDLTKFEVGDILRDENIFSNKEDYLTICAGIAFVKSSFPFYYGWNLAEDLCKKAKEKTKKDLNENQLPKSCLMFHKVQDSFTESYDEIVKRELTPREGHSWLFGPYYLDNPKQGFWTIDCINKKTAKLDSKDGNSVKSHLRQWMSLMHESEGMANQKLERLKAISSNEMQKFIDEATTQSHDNAYPVYDILTLHTINSQVTK